MRTPNLTHARIFYTRPVSSPHFPFKYWYIFCSHEYTRSPTLSTKSTVTFLMQYRTTSYASSFVFKVAVLVSRSWFSLLQAFAHSQFHTSALFGQSLQITITLAFKSQIKLVISNKRCLGHSECWSIFYT